MFRSWKIGRVEGIDLYVHWSFLLVPALILFSNLGRGVPFAALAVGTALAVFGCVLLHELGHALAGRLFDIGTRDITLYPIGGVARLERMPESPFAELVIALAGPAVNVVIATGLFVGLQLSGARWLGSTAFTVMFLVQLLIANVVLVLFNMLPAFPMDGGRVFRALLSLLTDRLRATEIAVGVGNIVILLAVVGGMYFTGDFMLALIGAAVFMLGQRELAGMRMMEYQRQARAAQAPPSADYSGYTFDPFRRSWILWENGHAVGACSVDDPARPATWVG